MDEGIIRRCEPVDPLKNQRHNLNGISTKLWLDASDTGSFVLAERNADTTDASISSTNAVNQSRGVGRAFDKNDNSQWEPDVKELPDINATWTFTNLSK